MPNPSRSLRVRPAALAACALALALAACGGSGNASTPPASGAAPAAGTASVSSGDWPTFDFNAQRTGVGPANTGITGRNVRSLQQRRVHLDGTVDSSPIELHGVSVGGRSRDLIVVTTAYGKTIGIDAATGERLWEYTPPTYRNYAGTEQITTATPVADPDRRTVYAAAPDGMIRKLALSTGRPVTGGSWPVRVTFDPVREKIPSALNVSGRELIVTTGGYVGDQPPYQGHVVTIDRASGRIIQVWNSLCADAHHLIVPRTCGADESAIWGRSGVVVEPGSHRLLLATANATIGQDSPFDGRRFWPDSVVELTPDAGRLLHNWTPRNQNQLSKQDLDIGSTSPALLGTYAGRHLAVQGGKDGLLHLLDLDRLNGTRGPAGARLGGELQDIPTPGGTQLLSEPAVWSHRGRTYLFVADEGGTAVYDLVGRAKPRLHKLVENGNSGTSPVIAGGLLYVYDYTSGALNVYDPLTLFRTAALPGAPGHWNSPIVLGGRVILPEGNDNAHRTSGTLDIFHLPGR